MAGMWHSMEVQCDEVWSLNSKSVGFLVKKARLAEVRIGGEQEVGNLLY